MILWYNSAWNVVYDAVIQQSLLVKCTSRLETWSMLHNVVMQQRPHKAQYRDADGMGIQAALQRSLILAYGARG